MDLNGSAWICMDLHGSAWICMDLHGSAWICMDLYGSAWICIDLHELPPAALRTKEKIIIPLETVEITALLIFQRDSSIR
jgi:hypothetical protein